MSTLKLSIFELSPASQGRGHDDAIRETLTLAQKADAWGYRRFWLSEHHNNPLMIGIAPEVLAAAVAATTKRIRIGSAGVMLPHYAPLKVAEQFRVLEAIAPGRIDLGIGRGPGADELTARALNSSWPRGLDQFPQKVQELQAWVMGTPLPDRHPFQSVKAYPEIPTRPDLWILGMAEYSPRFAAQMGLPYAHASFLNESAPIEPSLSLYRNNYQPSARYPQPFAIVCVWALAADTEKEARRLLATREFYHVKGTRVPLVSLEEAAAYPYNEQERATIEDLRRRTIVGDADQVAERLDHLARELQVEELVLVTWAHSFEARMRSFELLANTFRLS